MPVGSRTTFLNLGIFLRFWTPVLYRLTMKGAWLNTSGKHQRKKEVVGQ